MVIYFGSLSFDSKNKYNFCKSLRFLSKSQAIPKGVITINVIAMNPNGFMYSAFFISPFNMNNTDLVVPHAGQVIPYIFLEKQTP